MTIVRKCVFCSALLFPFVTSSILANDYMAYPAMKQFIQNMTQQGFSQGYLEQTFSKIKRDNRILDLVNSPAEAKPWYQYRAIFLTEDRIRSGLGFWHRHEKAINEASSRYGVEPEYIVAIIGVETFYGRNTGKHNVLRSLTTLAMDFHKRSKFYTSELENFLYLIREERINNPFSLKGSYAGAMGLGQFISSSYRHYGVDFNQDGHKDIWHPEDAVGSVANYFARHGWQKNEDVTSPARILSNFYAKIAETKATKPKFSSEQLREYGVEPIGRLNSSQVSLLKLQGKDSDEYWVTGNNFYTITRYNHSPKYAMAVFQLAWEIKKRRQALNNPLYRK